MYNLDDIIKMYFSYVPVTSILTEAVSYNKFNDTEFQRLAKSYLLRYSDTENEEMLEFTRESTNIEGHPYAGMDNRSGLNVFAALEELAERLLTTENSQVVCQYSKLLRFREITCYVEEDLLVCAYLAMRNRRYGEPHIHFEWGTTVGHNNMQLNRIMEKGISENHFHLYGSAPAFQLIWMHLMNHVNEKGLADFFARIDEKPRSSRQHYYVGYQEEKTAVKVLQAALIRVFLITYLKDGSDDRLLSVSFADKLLKDGTGIYDYQDEIQQIIDYQIEYAFFTTGIQLQDYALFNAGTRVMNDKPEETLFAGERWFLYKFLESELNGKELPDKLYNWFYAYVVIKNSVRNEFIQTNHTVGFENFSIYNKRKNIYKDYDKMIRCAVLGSIRPGNLESLEIRVSPGETAEEDAGIIALLNRTINGINEDISGTSVKMPHIYYVFHFLKERDKSLPQETIYVKPVCRHYDKRLELYRKAKAIVEFRNSYPALAEKVLGLDACSQEIGCRPEVFAAAYRFLSNHVREDIPDGDISQLKMTYHVGEDFVDIVDGLRAVDEAIHFLNLQCGDRIGHGTVLGINVIKWYAFKENTVLISQQDYLDNVVWLYHKLSEFGIPDSESLKAHLAQQFDTYFSKIYLRVLQEEFNVPVKDDGAQENLMSAFQFNIHTYYEAWKLRGDDPKLYAEGSFQKSLEYDLEEYLVNHQYPERFENRSRREISFLYYLYHYNWKVRTEGSKITEIFVPKDYVNCVMKLQKAYAKYFSSCGIGVESNPSSNISISTMQSYDEHAIVRLYNKDLTWDVRKLEECPQINISINTDDKGVFHTSLENEYALMACALEKVRDKDGNLVYNRQMIYQWLDNIRQMGNLQSFWKRKI